MSTIKGTNKSDLLTGFAGNDVIDGGNGDDILFGRAGNDSIDGGNGNDWLEGEEGNDTLRGGNGDDVLLGGEGNDSLDGGNGEDRLEGGEGEDDLDGGNGDDTLLGGAGNDSIDGGNGKDRLEGGEGNDILSGGNGDDTLIGGAGNDTIYGGNGSDTAVYQGPIGNYIFELLDGGAIRVTDTTSADGIDLVYDVKYFQFANATVQANDLPFGVPPGPDTIDYSWTTLGVTVELATDSASGPEIGTEVLAPSIVNVIGGSGDDILRGDPGDNQLFGGDGNDLLVGGLGGNDLFDGGSGLDRVSFLGAANGVDVQLAAGIATIGGFTKTLLSVELVRGTSQNDTYDATGFSGASPNAGSNGTLNEFEGLGGDDSITGNGNTRVSYVNATAGVNVHLGMGFATGIDAGDLAGIGTDTFFGGINRVRGSQFNDELRGGTGNDILEGMDGDDFLGGGPGSDTLVGGDGFDTVGYGNAGAAVTVDLAAGTASGGHGNDVLISIEAVTGSAHNDTLIGNGGNNTLSGSDGNDVLIGGGGNDTLNGGNGIDIAAFGGLRSSYTFGAGTVSGPDGNDTTNGVELLRFDDAYMLGFGMAPINLVGFALTPGVAIYGRNGASDQLTMDTNANGRLIDLGGMGGSLTLQTFGAPIYILNLVNVDTLLSTGGIDTVTLLNTAVGMSIDLGTGVDTLNLGNGNNTVTVSNTENVTAGMGDDTVTFVAEVGIANQEINLGTGTNTLILEGDEDDLSLIVSGDNLTIIGQTSPVTGGNENLTLLNQQAGTTIDLGAGANDILTLAAESNDVTVSGAEQIFGSATYDTIRIVNDLGMTTVTAGFGTDWIVAGDSFDQFRFTSVQDSYSNAAERDIVENFDTTEDMFVFDGIAFVSSISFIDDAAFSGGGDNSEARLTDLGGGFELIEIDVDGDGTIGANDMSIELLNLNGTLFDGNFLIV